MGVKKAQAVIPGGEGTADMAFILKCTRRCNLRCVYCTDHRKSPETFDIPFVARLFDGIRRVEELRHITFIWHGGEPLLLGIPFFRKVHYLQGCLFPPGTVFNTIQTNACLLDEEWAAHLGAYRFQVGVSLDGPQHIHDRTRVFPDGTGSFSRAMAGLALLRRSGVPHGVLTVVSEAHVNRPPEALLEFYRENAIEKYSLLSLRKRWPSPREALRYNHAFGEFMARAIRYWLDRDDRAVELRELDSKLNLFFGLPNSVCKDGGACVGKYFGVEADKFMDDGRFYLGNLRETPLDRILASPRMKRCREMEDSIRRRCAPCPWYPLCRGGCLADLMYLLEIGGRVGTRDCVNFRIYEELSMFLESYYRELVK